MSYEKMLEFELINELLSIENWPIVHHLWPLWMLSDDDMAMKSYEELFDFKYMKSIKPPEKRNE